MPWHVVSFGLFCASIGAWCGEAGVEMGRPFFPPLADKLISCVISGLPFLATSLNLYWFALITRGMFKVVGELIRGPKAKTSGSETPAAKKSK
jgi:hypothetical protein